ncbi:MAG: hypothetical protein E7599_00080 [Ruminococcaceae bacterium]|nr:hypothetical protein [Oscillospiraceae bacterium]
MGKYQTEQKKLLLAFFASHPEQQFTAEEAASALVGEEEGQRSPGKSTVYRLVAEMAEDGHLKRFPKVDGGRGWLYQYHESHGCEGHLHLKCTLCGALTHLECGMSEELLHHIESTHCFKVDNTATVLYGLCGDCRSKQPNTERKEMKNDA